MQYDPITVAAGGSAGQVVQAINSCTNKLAVVTGDFPTWWTDDTSIATASGDQVNGVAPGTTNQNALSNLMYWGPKMDSGGEACPTIQQPVNAEVDVTPTISQSTPLWFFGTGIQAPSSFQLGSTSATLTANGGGNGTYLWTITAGTSRATLENNSSTITKTNVNTVGISSTSWSTAMNDVSVQLEYTPAGGSQLPAINWNLSIDSPYKLVSNGNVNTTGIAAGAQACEIPSPGGTDGYQTLVPYSMKSFFNAQITFEYVNESFGLQFDVSENNWPVYTPTNGFTPTGDFFDNICVVATGGSLTPQPLPPQSPLGSAEIDYGAQYWYVGSLTSRSGVEVQYDTLARYQDHGTVTDIVSPVR